MVLSPFILIIPASLPLAARIAVASLAILTSSVSTAAIAYVAGTYVGRIDLVRQTQDDDLPSKEDDSDPVLKLTTIDWLTRSNYTLVKARDLGNTDRPFATWQVAPSKSRNAGEAGDVVVAQTFAVKTGREVGQILASGKVVGRGVRHFNIHREILSPRLRAMVQA